MRTFARRSPIVGRLRAPASKPETQRALLLGMLASGTTVIRDPLYARETQVMMDACRAIGAKIDEQPDAIRIEGLGGRRDDNGDWYPHYIWAAGSALVARTFLTLGPALGKRLIIDGNNILRGRPFAPLFQQLRAKDVEVGFIDIPDRLPCATESTTWPGGRFRLATSISSQFTTALMVAAPLGEAPTTIDLVGPAYSLSYINQTADMMRRFDIDVHCSADGRQITIGNRTPLTGRTVEVTGDWTSASYILGAAFTSRGRIIVENLDPDSLQGERAILDIVEALGAEARWLPERHTLELDCTRLPPRVDVEFDLRDSPNILPTVAAVAASIPGRVRIRGARLTQLHKSPRIEAMAAELAKAGVPVTVLRAADGVADGLEVRGAAVHRGQVAFSSHGDHRIFMALVVFALTCRQACVFSDGGDTGDSFPGFFDILRIGEDGGGTITDERNDWDERELVGNAG